MRVTKHWGIQEPIHEFMQTITHREYEMRLAFLDEDWNRPSRSDHYLMLLIYVVQNLFSKKSKRFNARDYLLKFGGTRRRKLTDEEAQRLGKQSKSRWLGLLGFTGKKR